MKRENRVGTGEYLHKPEMNGKIMKNYKRIYIECPRCLGEGRIYE